METYTSKVVRPRGYSLLEWLASQPKSTENLLATWCPPDWPDIIEKWDEAVTKSRELTGIKCSPAVTSGRL